VLQGLQRSAVTADTEAASASADVDAATMHLEQHERGIHALRLGAGGAGGVDVCSGCVPWPTVRREPAVINLG
jgi:hypothetical protein